MRGILSIIEHSFLVVRQGLRALCFFCYGNERPPARPLRISMKHLETIQGMRLRRERQRATTLGQLEQSQPDLVHGTRHFASASNHHPGEA
jgi:hypothetical protein